ncbi:hypothetical protein [Spirosoma telluris]|uniref:hypothetical protein n=1 Tax=Spirosoma telluris TaxID=2183553 RepID=UPI002FC28E9F
MNRLLSANRLTSGSTLTIILHATQTTLNQSISGERPTQLWQDEKLDMATIQKIRQEGLQHSQVMETAFYLTDVNGPRLQGPASSKPLTGPKQS